MYCIVVYCRVVCVGGDGMFAELLNGIILMHNVRSGVDLHNEHSRLRQPELRIGVIPAGTHLSYFTTGILAYFILSA